jgi:hypothetical protein
MAVSVVTTVLQRIKCGTKKICKNEISGVYIFRNAAALPLVIFSVFMFFRTVSRIRVNPYPANVENMVSS